MRMLATRIRRIRARGAPAYRGDSRRLDRLAEAAPQLGMTVATGGRGNVRVGAFTGEQLSDASEPHEFVTQSRELFTGLDRASDLVSADDDSHKGLTCPLYRIEGSFLACDRFDRYQKTAIGLPGDVSREGF